RRRRRGRRLHGSAPGTVARQERRAERAEARSPAGAARQAAADPPGAPYLRGDTVSKGVKSPSETALDLARKVLRIEAAAILGLLDRLNGDFERAVDILFECRGRVIVTGMGKSGII